MKRLKSLEVKKDLFYFKILESFRYLCELKNLLDIVISMCMSLMFSLVFTVVCWEDIWFGKSRHKTDVKYETFQLFTK